MQITDTIADMLTRIRNANSAKHDTVDIPASNMKKAIAQILVDEGFVKGFTVIEDGKQRHPHDPEIRRQQGSGHHRPAPGLQARSAHLLQLRGYAQSYEGPWRGDCFHFQRRYDR